MTRWLSVLAIFFSVPAFAKTVRYELRVANQKVNLSGKKEVDWALTVNGGIPAPVLEFTEGDDAEITVKNELKDDEVSIHWHGILLPPSEDGVAYVNTPPIFPGQSRVFKFRLRQNGTYWYHSHTHVQEQKGVYGALIIHPRKETIKADKEAVVVLSDWTDENPDQVIRNLRKDGDYYLYKKNSVRSLGGALSEGKLGAYLSNEWQRMGGMDLSDVGYDLFLSNGKRDAQLVVAHPGERVRLRIINAAASTYFYVSLAGLPMRVISADGQDIQPMDARELLMGMAETYDVLFTVPDHKNYELRATAQDVTGFTSSWIGMGERVLAPLKPKPDMYMSMDHSAHGMQGMDHSGHAEHSGHAMPAEPALEIVDQANVDELRALAPTTLPKSAKVTDLKLVLGGNMSRYVWTINGKTISEDRTLLINEGDVVRFTLENETMMHHPMHLHGHFFRVLNKNGERSPLKHTVDVPPHGTRTIEFYANEKGQWMLHCHNLYHMKSGMARVVKYSSFTPPPEIAAHEGHDPHLHDHIYSYGLLEAATNHARGNFKLMRTRDEAELKLESRSDSKRGFTPGGQWDLEGDLLYRRWLGDYTSFMAGATGYDEKGYGIVGFGYKLPLLVQAQAFVNHDGKFRLDLEKTFQWTKTLQSQAEFTWRPDWKGEYDGEFEVTFMYAPNWTWAAGLMLTNDSIGAGVQARF
jgi:FtsP/CotA-like multicopper oxidase with cupredoxin domain